MSAAIQAACDAAMVRIKKHINRCAGQHKRAVASAFALAGAPVVAEVEAEAQGRLPCCASPRPDCMGMLIEGIGDRCQAMAVSEGAASAQRINRGRA